jgi:hypothetical protein
MEKWFALQLLQAVDADGVYKFIIETLDAQDKDRVLLVSSPDHQLAHWFFPHSEDTDATFAHSSGHST